MFLQPDKVEFELKLGQSKPLYNAFKDIKESSNWDALSEAQKRIVECEYVVLILIQLAIWRDSLKTCFPCTEAAYDFGRTSSCEVYRLPGE